MFSNLIKYKLFAKFNIRFLFLSYGKFNKYRLVVKLHIYEYEFQAFNPILPKVLGEKSLGGGSLRTCVLKLFEILRTEWNARVLFQRFNFRSVFLGKPQNQGVTYFAKAQGLALLFF